MSLSLIPRVSGSSSECLYIARSPGCLSRSFFLCPYSTFLHSMKLCQSRRRSWETARLRKSFSPLRTLIRVVANIGPGEGRRARSRLSFRPLFILFNLTVETDKANRPMRRVTGEIPGTFFIAVDLNYDVRFESGLPLPAGRLFPILPL